MSGHLKTLLPHQDYGFLNLCGLEAGVRACFVYQGGHVK